MAAFLGTIFVWEKWLPQSHRGQAPALNRQGGNVRVAAPYHVEFLFQNEYASYTGRSGRTSLCSRRLAGRWFFQLQSQTCHKLVPAFAATWYWARLLLSNISWKIYNAPMTSFGQIDFVQNKNAIFQTPRNQLSAGCAPWFWKLWGERAQRSENFQKN